MIISFLSQKGGVGKSTLARLIAREYAANGWNVKIADMDTRQGTCVSWHRRREDAGITPSISAETYSNVQKALKDYDHYDLMVFDSAPHGSEMTLQMAKVSDINILPCGFALDDLEPQVLLAHEMVKKGIRKASMAFAFCGVGESAAERNEAKDYIEGAGYKLLQGSLLERTAYRRASDVGKAVSETTFPSLNKKASQLAQSVIDFASSTQKKGKAA